MALEPDFLYLPEEVCFVGDTHGNLQWWKKVFNYHIIQTEDRKTLPTRLFIQVGDFGFWKHTKAGAYYLSWLNERLDALGAELLFIRGNHENQRLLAHYNYGSLCGLEPMAIDDYIGWLPDGSTITIGEDEDSAIKLAVFGGAVSPDRPYRQRYEGIEWWPEEEISFSQLNYFQDNVDDDIDILLTHDGPNFVPIRTLLGGPGFPMPPDLEQECKEGRKLIDKAVDHCNPRFVVHGHFHWRHVTELDGYPLVVGLDRDDQLMEDSTILMSELLKFEIV